MAASKVILLLAPQGQLLWNKQIIPVKNIAELLEYVLLPHNNEVTKPRALNTFLDWLAELEVDNGLIENKTLLSDFLEKEKGYRNAENTSDNESNNEESSSDIENQEGEEVAPQNGSETVSVISTLCPRSCFLFIYVYAFVVILLIIGQLINRSSLGYFFPHTPDPTVTV